MLVRLVSFILMGVYVAKSVVPSSAPTIRSLPPTITRLPTKTPLRAGQFCNDRGTESTYTESLVDKNGETIRMIEASGCPNHKSRCVNKDYEYCQSLGNTLTDAVPQDFRLRVPAEPCFANNRTNVTCKGGILGILRNGVAIYSAKASEGCTSAMTESDSFDHCGASHSTYRYNQYHVHGNPTCLLDQINGNEYPENREFSHEHLIGWALDGFPIYGPHKADGRTAVLPCQHSDDPGECLDSCNGHLNDHVDDGFKYHYHLTGDVAEGIFKPGAYRLYQPQPTSETNRFWPFTIGCYVGVLSDWAQANLRFKDGPAPICAEAGVDDTYVAESMTGFTDVYSGDVCQYPECTAKLCRGSPNRLCSARMADPSILVDPLKCADPCGVTKCGQCGKQGKCTRACKRMHGKRAGCQEACADVESSFKCLSQCQWN